MKFQPFCQDINCYFLDDDCYHDWMLYDYKSDGTLTHHCSGKRICTGDDGKLMISSQCGVEQSKFDRTAVSEEFFILMSVCITKNLEK